jgi:hypothetical protein
MPGPTAAWNGQTDRGLDGRTDSSQKCPDRPPPEMAGSTAAKNDQAERRHA